MTLLSRDILKPFQEVTNCEKASIMFHNQFRRELTLFLEDGGFVVFSNKKGIAGECARTGRFSTFLMRTIFRFQSRGRQENRMATRSVPCEPVYCLETQGVIAVVQMLNKRPKVSFRYRFEVLKCLLYKAFKNATHMAALIESQTIVSKVVARGSRRKAKHTIHTENNIHDI